MSSQTRKKTKQQILQALDDIREFVLSCGTDVNTNSSLSTLTTPSNNQVSEKKTDAVCPGGPATWNQFQKMYMETHADELKDIPYDDVQKIISKAYRSTACGTTIEKKVKRRQKTLRISNNNQNNNIPPKTTRTRKTRSVKTMPAVTQNITIPQELQTQSRRFNMGSNFVPRLKTLQTHEENTRKSLANMERNNPELAGDLYTLQTMLDTQRNTLHNLSNAYKADKETNFSPLTYKTYQNTYDKMVQNASLQKTKINDQLQTLKAKAKVRLQLPNSSQIKIPGVNSTSTLSSPTSLNSKKPRAAQTMFSNLQTTSNAPMSSKMVYNGPPENGLQKVRINGKKYFYWENEEGKHLRNRNNNDNPGNNIGIYNENAPGYFRPE
jgi:hypothetical protein